MEGYKEAELTRERLAFEDRLASELSASRKEAEIERDAALDVQRESMEAEKEAELLALREQLEANKESEVAMAVVEGKHAHAHAQHAHDHVLQPMPSLLAPSDDCVSIHHALHTAAIAECPTPLTLPLTLAMSLATCNRSRGEDARRDRCDTQAGRGRRAREGGGSKASCRQAKGVGAGGSAEGGGCGQGNGCCAGEALCGGGQGGSDCGGEA